MQLFQLFYQLELFTLQCTITDLVKCSNQTIQPMQLQLVNDTLLQQQHQSDANETIAYAQRTAVPFDAPEENNNISNRYIILNGPATCGRHYILDVSLIKISCHTLIVLRKSSTGCLMNLWWWRKVFMVLVELWIVLASWYIRKVSKLCDAHMATWRISGSLKTFHVNAFPSNLLMYTTKNFLFLVFIMLTLSLISLISIFDIHVLCYQLVDDATSRR